MTLFRQRVRPWPCPGRLITVVFVAVLGSVSVCGQEQPPGAAREAVRRVPLSEGQGRAVAVRRRVQPERPAPLFVFTDPNKDPDDLSVLVVTKYLHEHRFVELRCVVATLGDRDVRTTRAKFTRSVLDQLGLTPSRR